MFKKTINRMLENARIKNCNSKLSIIENMIKRKAYKGKSKVILPADKGRIMVARRNQGR